MHMLLAYIHETGRNLEIMGYLTNKTIQVSAFSQEGMGTAFLFRATPKIENSLYSISQKRQQKGKIS